MGQDLSGKVAIVTGGASGIGRATAELFVEEGAQVVVADVDTEQGEELSASLGGAAAFQRTDVSDADDVQALVDFTVGHFGGLDVMFNNAGIPSSFRRILDNDLRDFHRVMGVNLFGVMVGTQLAARHMAEHGGGSIINTSSIAALSGGAGPIIYRVSKAAVVQYSRSAAVSGCRRRAQARRPRLVSLHPQWSAGGCRRANSHRTVVPGRLRRLQAGVLLHPLLAYRQD